MDLYQLNELGQSGVKEQNQYDNQSLSYNSASAIFIKALEKAMEKINSALAILSQVQIKDDAKFEERSAQDSKLLLEFTADLELAIKIVDEFQRATSMLYDDNLDAIRVGTEMNNGFSFVIMNLNMLAITKDEKYSESAISMLDNLIKLFKQMAQSVNGE